MESIKSVKIKNTEDLGETLNNARENSALRVLVLAFENEKLFANGNDLDDELLQKIKHFPIPIITMIKDISKGNIFKLMLAGHICFASNDAKFFLDDRKDLAIEAGSKNVEKLKTIKDIFDAETALDIGIINKIVKKENLESEALKMAETISNLAPIAIRSCLKAVNKGLETNLEDGLRLETELFSKIFATKDMKEGTSAFLEKRKPIFRGE